VRVVDMAVRVSVAGAMGCLLAAAECLAQGFSFDSQPAANSMPPLALGLSSAGVRAFNDEFDDDLRALNAFGGRNRVDQYTLPGHVKPRHWTFYGRLGIFNFQDYVNQSRSEGMRLTLRRTGPKLTGRIYIGIHREF
jgi:hypothetical protein